MSEEYRFREWCVREHIVEALKRYVTDHTPLGDFLTAVLANDLQGAVSRADGINLANLPAFAAYVHNEVPHCCRGSYEIVEAWLKAREEKTA